MDGGTGSEYDILTHEWNASFQCMDRWFYNMNVVCTRYRHFGACIHHNEQSCELKSRL
jgi:hypothetical protein